MSNLVKCGFFSEQKGMNATRVVEADLEKTCLFVEHDANPTLSGMLNQLEKRPINLQNGYTVDVINLIANAMKEVNQIISTPEQSSRYALTA